MDALKNILKNLSTEKQCENIVKASSNARYLLQLMGMCVVSVESAPSGRLVLKFCWFGFLMFLFNNFTYFYCICIVFVDGQSIVRSIYKTKLKHYGDYIESILSIIFVLYSMPKVPFRITGDIAYKRRIVEVDEAIKKMDEQVDYMSQAHTVLVLALAPAGVSLMRVCSVYISLASSDIVPIEKMVQLIYADVIALLITMLHCGHINLLRQRFRIVNISLRRIKDRRARYRGALSRITISDTKLGTEHQEKYICDKIKACAKTHELLMGCVVSVNKIYGFAMVQTMSLCLVHIVLYLFYLMEATASGLYNDANRYVHFVFYVSWQILYGVSVIFFNIHYCEITVKEAKITSRVVHQIINSDISPRINKEAMTMSTQLIHHVPEFTACGLYPLNYTILLEGFRTVITFLALLLQFVLDK